MSSLAHILINQDNPPPPPSPSSTSTTKTTSTSALLPSPMESILGKRERNTSSTATLPSQKRQSPSFQNNNNNNKEPLQQQELQDSATPHTEQMTPPPSQYGSPVQYRHPRPLLAATEAQQQQSPLAAHMSSSSRPPFPHTPLPSPRPSHQHQPYRPSQYSNVLAQGPNTNIVPLRPKHRAEYAYASTREEPRRLEPSKLPYHVDQQPSASPSHQYHYEAYQALPNASTTKHPPDQRPLVGEPAPHIRSHRKASSWSTNISASLSHPNRQMPTYITGHSIPFSSTASSPASVSTYPALAPSPFYPQYAQQHQHGQQQRQQQQHPRYHHARHASASIPGMVENHTFEKDLAHQSRQPVEQNTEQRMSPCRTTNARIAPTQPQSLPDIYPRQPRRHHTLQPNFQYPVAAPDHHFGHPYTLHTHMKSHGPYPIASDANSSRKHYLYPSARSDTQPGNVGSFDASGTSTSKYTEIGEEKEGNPRMPPNTDGGNRGSTANSARAPDISSQGTATGPGTATEEVNSTMNDAVGRFKPSSGPKEAIAPASARPLASPRTRPPSIYPAFPQNQIPAQTTLCPKLPHPALSQVSIYTLCRRWLHALGENEPAETSLLIPGSTGQVPSGGGGPNGGGGGRRSKGEPLSLFFRSGTATPSSNPSTQSFDFLSATDMALQSALRSLRSARPGPPGEPSEDQSGEVISTTVALTDEERKTRMKALDLLLDLGTSNTEERNGAVDMDLDCEDEGQGNEKGMEMSVSNEEQEPLDVKELLRENQKEWKKARERDISAFRIRVLGIASARLHAALDHVQKQCMLQQQKHQHQSLAGAAARYAPPLHIQTHGHPLHIQQ